MKKLAALQEKHPVFVYQNFRWEIKQNSVHCQFQFLLKPDISFTPTVSIENLNRDALLRTDHADIDRLVFNLGLMEIPSYWKASLAPKISIKTGHLHKKQIAFWRRLLFKGLGEFFYRNNINPETLKVQFSIASTDSYVPYHDMQTQKDAVLLPIGGGKDSLVTLEALKQTNNELILFALNPTEATKTILQQNKNLRSVIVKREIDPQLLALNNNPDYFNGHTPFSAYLAFLTSLVALIEKIPYIAVSNEASADEATVIESKEKFNHQYSKTTDFEERFRNYQKDFLVPGHEYFSFLRPLYEIQIAQLFAHTGQAYFSSFRSCNRGQKKNVWCHECPKCLFAFLILFPFIDETVLTTEIFHSNLFAKKSLLPDAMALSQVGAVKPWECVGTKEESIVAFYLSREKYKAAKKKLPIVLAEIDRKVLKKEKNLDKRAKKVLRSWKKKHFLPATFAEELHQFITQHQA